MNIVSDSTHDFAPDVQGGPPFRAGTVARCALCGCLRDTVAATKACGTAAVADYRHRLVTSAVGT